MMRPQAPRKPKVERTAFRLHLEYDGSRYQGWQRQGEKQTAQGVKTIAGTLERILAQAGVPPLALVGSGRTDAGVHALDQVAHLHLAKRQCPTPADLVRLFQDQLPHDIVLRSLAPCPTGFHARHDAVARTYLYCVTTRRTAFAKPFVWWVRRPLDGDLLNDALGQFLGMRDVSAFADRDPDDDPRCQIQACHAVREGSLWIIQVKASHFLRRQVRRMVGAAVGCGTREFPVAMVAKDLARPTPEATLHWSERAAPSAGLFLAQVHYPGETLPEPRPWFQVS